MRHKKRLVASTYNHPTRNRPLSLIGMLNVFAAKSYVAYQDLENKQMLHEFVTEPNLFLHHIWHYSNALTTTMVFG